MWDNLPLRLGHKECDIVGECFVAWDHKSSEAFEALSLLRQIVNSQTNSLEPTSLSNAPHIESFREYLKAICEEFIWSWLVRVGSAKTTDLFIARHLIFQQKTHH